MRGDDDNRDNRNRAVRARETIANTAPALSDGPIDQVCMTYAPYGTAYPTAVGSYFALKPQLISGPEVPPGTVPTFADDPNAGPIAALCLGPGVPAVGAYVLVSTSPEGRFVFVS